MNKDPAVFIEHILESIRHIESFSKGISKTKFSKDRLKQKSVML